MEDMGNYGYTLFRTIPKVCTFAPDRITQHDILHTDIAKKILFVSFYTIYLPNPHNCVHTFERLLIN